jgi:polysaccharide pyruvyl transferase WcaK-like protein
MQKLFSKFTGLLKIGNEYIDYTDIDRNNIDVDTYREKLLILGFFNRHNVGDEAFIPAYKILFPDKDLIFKCIDDIHEIQNDVTAVIIGGGDVINDYFMEKIKMLLLTYNGPCYAFSVGIPYTSQSNYVSLFDHVVVRSKQDIEITSSVVGEKNVEYLPDITWLLKSTLTPTKRLTKINNKKFKIKIGICLAQPIFFENPKEKELIDELVKCLRIIIREYPLCEISLIPFNTSKNICESDYIINDKIFKRLSNYRNIKNITHDYLGDPIRLLKFIGTQDIIIGMRFHSIIFSMINDIPVVPVYCSRKIDNLIEKQQTSCYAYKLPTDEKYRPSSFDSNTLFNLFKKRLNTPYEKVDVDSVIFNRLVEIVEQKKRKQILVKALFNKNYDEVLSRTIKMIKTYLQINDEEFTQWVEHKTTTRDLLEKVDKDAANFARLICFGITNKIGVPYIWGLKDNMFNDDFKIYEAIKWIYEDYEKTCSEIQSNYYYYPVLNPVKKVILDMNYMCQDNYQGLHRSGWSYVISGLQHIETENVAKPSRILLDTCLERTFLWGLDITKTANIVPYKKDWAGIIHHTFNTTYSKYNCATLINTPEFIDSLPHCKCLITLSVYLKNQLIDALEEKGILNIPVINVIHPTEFVDNNFEIGKFARNKNRKILHVGAWLRNPYSIYALPIPDNNKLGLKKVAIKGKEMDNYFRPKWLFDKMIELLHDYNLIYEYSHQTDNPCRVETICRPNSSLIKNKYLEGMLEQLKEEDKSVEIVEFIKNNDYDKLLSENIVFLNLVDASASNTVIEGIVRNTPLVINRLPALEEELGKDYPGFYSSLFEAAVKLIDMNKIMSIHEYLKKLDKRKYTLDYFLDDFQNKLLRVLEKPE